MKFLNTVYHNDGKIAIDTKNPPENSGGFESQQLFAFLDSSLWCYHQKRENYNSKDIGSKFVVNAFLRGLIVTFFADN